MIIGFTTFYRKTIFDNVMNRFFLFCLSLIFLFSACRKERLLTDDPAAKLTFSLDTVVFDTVFTTVGSATRRLKVYNPNKKAVKISEIRLMGGDASPYDLNIDGLPASLVQDYELAGGDSLHIFAKVTVDPTADKNPFVVSDSIRFLTNGNKQQVQLAASGQNAHFYADSVLVGDQTWTNDLPHVIYGVVVLDTLKASRLTIQKGTKVYFHKGGRIIVPGGGQLVVEGALNDSVIFQGDRLEKEYFDEPGQWNSIQFLPGSIGNSIDYAVIKNAVFGVIVGTINYPGQQPDLTISNSVIKHMTVTGLFGINGIISSYNNLLFDCGQYAIFGAYGGGYEVYHNTIGNFNSFGVNRQTPSVLFIDYLQDDLSPLTNPLSVDMVDNIIWGSLEDEFGIDAKSTGTTSLTFDYNLVRSKITNLAANNVLNKDPLFRATEKEDYHIKNNTSPVYQKGFKLTIDPIFLKDLDGKSRLDPPSIGCYEVF